MKLSTNKLFSSARYHKNSIIKSKKYIYEFSSSSSKIHCSQISDNFQYHSKNKNEAKLYIQKSSKSNHNASPKVNPFNDESDNFSKNKTNHLKSKNTKEQKTISDNQKTKKDISPKHIDSGDGINDLDINNIILTNQSDSNKNNESEYKDFELLCDLFKKNSKLKSNIIIDNNGNNNLNSDQEKFITDCFNKKEKLEKNINKCKINNFKARNYKQSDKFLKQNKKSNKKEGKIKQLSKDMENNKFQCFSCKNNYKYLFGLKLIKGENEKNKESNNDEINSMFENCTNKSLDSSFLDSSIAEDFKQTLTKAEANIIF